MKKGKQFLSLVLVLCIVAGLSNTLALAAPYVGDINSSTSKREVTFTYHNPSATNVYVSGSFDTTILGVWKDDNPDWKMTNDGKGDWTLTKQMDEGEYLYRFVVDGRYEKDPDNNFVEKRYNRPVNKLVVPGEVTSPVVDVNYITINFPASKVPSGTINVIINGNFSGVHSGTTLALDNKTKHYTAKIEVNKSGTMNYKIGFTNSTGVTTYTTDYYNMWTNTGQDTSFVKVNGYTLSFNANGGSGTMADMTDVVGNNNLPSNTFVAPVNKRFKGWSETADGTGILYNGGSNFYINKNTTLYAIWEDDPASLKYTISFNANGGTGTMANADVTVGNYAIPNNGFVAPAGKRFKAWALNSTSGIQYNAGDNYTVGSDVTFYAIWEDITHTVTFDSNGGSGRMSSVTANEGSYTLPANTFTPQTGKQFKGWSETIDGSGTVYNQGAAFNLTKDTTLYAIWENDPSTTFQVSFNANGGSGSMVPVDENGAYTLPSNGFTPPAGKRFKTWAMGSASGTQHNVGSNYNVTANVTFYAVWEDITYTVTFNGNGGTGSMSNVTVNEGSYTLPANTFSPPTGKQFKGWSETSAGLGTIYNQGAAFNLTKDTTLYAIWEKEPALNRTVSFNANGGSGFMNNADATDGLDYKIPSNGFTAPDGYKFKAWAEGRESGKQYNVGDNYRMSTNITFYAVWEKLPTISISASSTSISGGGSVTLTTSPVADSVICSDESIIVTGSGNTWKATLPNTTASYTFSASADGYISGQCTVSVTQNPIEKMTIIRNTELTEVPEGLKSTNFNTIEKIENELIRVVTQNSEYTVANTTISDVKMQISLDGGKTWVEATEADFPTEGITVKLPYPQSTGKDSHDFSVAHMFTTTSARLGTVAGQTETPEVKKLDDGIQVTLKGLSPVVIAWKPATTTPSDSETSEETKNPDNTTTSDSETSEETKAPADTTTSDVQNNSNVLETQSALANSTDSDKAKDVKSDNSVDVLETGDNRIISLYIGTMIASLIGFISIVTIRKRKRDKKDLTK